jgi:2-haloacid dehalogenase
MKSSRDSVEALIFDAYGTLFDTHSVVETLESDFPGRGEFLTQLWRLKQLEYSWLCTAGEDYRDFAEVTRAALRYSLVTLGLSADGEQVEKLATAYDRLSLYPDVVPALNSLAGWRVAIFSNGSPDMLKTLTINAGVIDRFEALMSVDAARAFKPSPKAYQLACDRLGLRPRQVLLVSSNGFDLQGAGRFGLRTVRIERFKDKDLRNRLGQGSIDASAMFLALRSQVECMEPAPDVTIDTLLKLERALVQIGTS